jgi:uncharacterized protein (DUF342 family)
LENNINSSKGEPPITQSNSQTNSNSPTGNTSANTNVKPDENQPKPIDAKINISVDSSFKDASVTIIQPQFGGAEPTYEEIMRELELRSVVFGIDTESVRRMVEEKFYDMPFVIAKFKPPVNGVDGTIEYKFEKEYKPKPKIDEETGRADFKALDIVRIILANTVIAEITHPTEGEPGMDVRGRVIPQKKGAKAPYAIGKNTDLSTDGLRLTAAADGVLAWVKGCFQIDTSLTLENVDSSTGNISFIGDIVVRGDINEGFKVHSDKNITVHGTVSGATLEAGGKITIKTGCLRSNLKASEDVVSGYFENCSITTDGNITSQSFSYCTVFCGGSITTKGVGVIVGGQYTCIGNVQCNVIGSKNYIKTEIIAGNNAMYVKEKETITEAIAEIEDVITELTKDIKYLMESKASLGADFPKEKQATLDHCMKKRMIEKRAKSDRVKRIEEIDKLLERRDYNEVSVKTVAYPNVSIHIGQAVLALENKYEHTVFTLNPEENTIKFKT